MPLGSSVGVIEGSAYCGLCKGGRGILECMQKKEQGKNETMIAAVRQETLLGIWKCWRTQVEHYKKSECRSFGYARV